MNRISTFLLGVIAGAGGLYTSENYYIVRGKQQVHLVPKVAAKIEFPYRDIRSFTAEDWQQNASLALAIVKADKQDLLVESGLDSMRYQFDNLLRSLGESF
jgi:hypothetical protein